MKIFYGFRQVTRFYRKPVVAIGVFDGLHRGHCRLIRQAVAKAKSVGGTAVVVTFDPHPVHVLRPGVYLPLLISLPYRLRLMQEMGIDVCVVVKFTRTFSRLIPEQFIRSCLLGRISPWAVFVGDDFRFGQDRRGTLEYFRRAAKDNHFKLQVIPAGHKGKKQVSSTRIRQFIAAGKLAQAEKLLGRPVSLLGRVVRGDARGRTLGYRTANINPSPLVILPQGVFAARVRRGKESWPGMANVGYRPSFKRTGRVNVEVHLFCFHGDLYGKEIVVEFLNKIRDEKQFWSQEELIQQIRKDEQKVKEWFRKKKIVVPA